MNRQEGSQDIRKLKTVEMRWRVDSWRQLRSEESRELKSVGNNRGDSRVCQELKRAGNWRELSTRKTLSRFKDDRCKPDQKTVPDKEVKRLKCWGERRPDKQKATGKIVKIQRCREVRTLSRFRNVRSKPDQETVAASDKDVESKKRDRQRLPRDHAFDGRASQGVRRCSL